MFIYLSKKIAIPNNTTVHCLAWNKEDGYISVGGESGLLKVLKLDTDSPVGQQEGTKSKGLAITSNLSMNQTLDGHNEAVKVITWNETHRKLTSSDQNGVIIVWMMYKGTWYEEMINNRKKSTVVGMTWSSDGLKICIIYEDGAVIVGSVDGNRIWGKELKNTPLSGVQWSPDGKLLLFSLKSGEVHLYDNLGNFVMSIEIHCVSGKNESIVCLAWYDGKHGQMHALCPSLAICFANGRLQLMCNESDTNPVIIDCEMAATYCSWNHNGSLLAVAGRQKDDNKYSNAVQFFSAYGDHLRTLKVPGLNISCCVWEEGSLRVALGVDSCVYFANIRPDYKWCYVKKAVVFASCRPQKAGVCISFWDTTNNQCHTRYVPVLWAMASCEEHCVLVTRSDTEDGNGQCGLLLYNAMGTLVDGKYVDLEIRWVSMNNTHVAAASKNNFIIWQYKTPKSSIINLNRDKYKLFHVDDSSTDALQVILDLQQTTDKTISSRITIDPVCCLEASDKLLIVGRESGALQFYSLPHITLVRRIKLQSRPHKIAINCNSTRYAVIDVAGMLAVLDVMDNFDQIDPNSSEANKLERKDVWAMCWASDNPQLLAIMEKTRMYIFKGIYPEEPISSAGYICSFQDLEIEAVLLDEVMAVPEKPSNKDHLIKLEVKSLRDTRQLLEKVGIKEAALFIEDNPHPRLWHLLGEAALLQLDLTIAETAFIRSPNYSGIKFVKKLQTMPNDSIRRACVAAYFKKFDEAEHIYIESDRRDLALNLRQTLGDWFRVIQLMKNGISVPDLFLEMVYNSTGDYFVHNGNWAAAVEYYEHSKNRAELVECFYQLEDFTGMERMLEELPPKDPLLKKIGDLFAVNAVYAPAVQAYLKLGDVSEAINLCVANNQWDRAIELARTLQLPGIEDLFFKYSEHLVSQNQLMRAIEINIKSKFYIRAAKYIHKLAEKIANKAHIDLVKIKKLYVHAALLLDMFDRGPNKDTAESINEINLLENAWKIPEAYHYLLLVHRQIYGGRYQDALLTAHKLLDYTKYLPYVEVYSIVAQTACLAKAYGICSKALICLKQTPNLSKLETAEYKRLGLNLFTKQPPVRSSHERNACYQCKTPVFQWSQSCPTCLTYYPTCVLTGRPLNFERSLHWVCSRCHHSALKTQIMIRKTCPLCHEEIKPN